MPSNAAEIGSNRSDEITGHVHDYVPLPERFGGASAPTKLAEALLWTAALTDPGILPRNPILGENDPSLPEGWQRHFDPGTQAPYFYK